MIELISSALCIACDRCVEVCPTQVFDAVGGGIPVIARPDSCQTCFMCELYCPVDAMYVHPFADQHVVVIEEQTILGGYAKELGWKSSKPGGTENDQTHHLFEMGIR